MTTAADEGDRNHPDDEVRDRLISGLRDLLISRLHSFPAPIREDAAQEAIVEALRLETQPGRERGGPRDPWRLAFLVVVARRKAIRLLRRQRRQQALDDSMECSLPFRQGQKVDLCDMEGAIERVIAKLPPQQRKCVELRFLHDLSGAETAAELGITRNAVEQAVKYAKQHLGSSGIFRRLRDIHAAGPYGGLAWRLRSLPQTCPRTGRGLVRACGALFGSLVGVGAVPKLSAAFLSLAAVAVAGWWLLAPEATAVAASSHRGAHSAVPTHLNERMPEHEATAQSMAVERQVLGTARGVLQAGFIAHGRCVGENGEPLLGVHVRLCESPKAERMATGPKRDVEQVTGADGCFQLSLEPAPGQRYALALDMPERVGPPARELEPTVHELGDITMYRSVRVTGRLLDESEQPVPYVELQAYEPERDASEVATSKADGSFEFPALSAGRWSLSMRIARLWQVVSSQVLVIDRGEQRRHVIVQLRPLAGAVSIAGRVTDEQGKPVEREVRAIGSCGGWSESSRADGRFVIDAQGRPDDAVRLELVDGNGFELIDCTRTYRWGQRDVTVVVRPAARSLEAAVVDETGEPVEDYEVRWWPERLTDETRTGDDQIVRVTWQPPPHTASGHHARGVAVLEKLPKSRGFLIVVPARHELLPSTPLLIEPDGVQRVPVRVHRAVALRVTLVSRDATPMVGCHVELLRGCAPRPGMDAPTIDLDSAAASIDDMFENGGRRATAWLLAEATTDEHGVATLRCSPLGASCSVRAPGPGHVPTLRNDVFVGNKPEPVTMIVDRGATLRGTVELRERLLGLHGTTAQERPAIELEQVAERPVPWPAAALRATIDEHGAFIVADVPPGIWRVWLAGFRVHNGESERFRPSRPLGTVRLAAGRETQVQLEAPDLSSGTLTGTLRMRGQLSAGLPLRLEAGYRDDDGAVIQTDAYCMQAPTGDDGGFVFRNLAPGLYRLHTRLRSHEKYDYSLDVSDWIDVTPGCAVQRDLQVPTRAVVLHVRRRDGTPLARWGFTVEVPAMSLEVPAMSLGSVTTDDDGCIRLEHFPRGATLRTQLEMWNEVRERMTEEEFERRAVVFGPFEVPAGGTFERELFLPR